jgi:uncharacterized sodium:solute symporter family permease YidK
MTFRELNLSKKFGAFAAVATSLVMAFFANSSAGALSLMDVVNGNFRGEGQPTELFGSQAAIIPRAINLMLFAVGVLAIFMLIWGGLRYVLSGGDAGRVKDAKNTILYAIIGLVVAILGYAIVNWVIQVVGAGASGGSASV